MPTQLTKAKVVRSDLKSTDKLFTFMIIYDFAGVRIKGNMSTFLYVTQSLRILDRQIKQIIKLGYNTEILLCVGLEANLIIQHVHKKYSNFNIRIVENANFDLYNSCESLRLLLNNTLSNNIIVFDHMASISKRIISRMNEERTYAIVNKAKDNGGLIGVNIANNKKIEHFCFGACQEWKNVLGLFNKEDICNIKSQLFSKSYKKKFIFELMNDIIDKCNISIKAIEVK